jgi:hypothetical protein
VFSIGEGVLALRATHHRVAGLELVLSSTVLGFALVMEGSSLIRATLQTRREARRAGRTMAEQIRYGNDPTVKTVFSEDSAAVIGIVLAAVGLTLRVVTGNPVFDATASIAIGGLLIWVAYALGRDNKARLIGAAADPRLRLDLVTALTRQPEVDGVLDRILADTMRRAADAPERPDTQ